MSKRVYYALAVLILLIAAALRFWNITTLPAGLSDIELSHVDVARDEIYGGDIRVFYEREVPRSDSTIGQEGLYHVVLSGAAVIFGMGTFGLRVLSLLIGMITIATIYTLGVRLFGYRVSIVATTFYAILMFPIILSRMVLVETAVPLMVAAVMLSLARALPVYYRTRAESTNTVDYATMGVLVSLSLYLHQYSLFIVLLAMAFITFILIEGRPVSLRKLSYIGFAILMLIIVAMPYLLSTFRLPELGANTRILGDFNGITLSIVESTSGLFWQGDTNPLHNVPGRPMFDAITGIVMFTGLVFCIRNWRNPRYALVLIGIILLGPPAILADNSPNFLALSLVLPIVVLLIGLGAEKIIILVPENIRPLSMIFISVLCIGNLGWTINSLYIEWAQSEEVQLAYNGDLGRIAHHFDLTADEIPVVICNPEWNITRATDEAYSDVEIIKVLMNRDTALLREVDCRNGFLFVNAGFHQQVLVVDPMNEVELFPLVADWLSLGTPVDGLPEGTVINLQVQQELEDALGVFTTTAPASYATESDVSENIPVAPPIPFGGNVTWLGYENDPLPEYEPGEIVPVTTYWRIQDGVVPSDLLIFTHILSDPISRVAQIDSIYIDPTQLGERDVYIHNANIPLLSTIESGDYVVSIGVYQSSSAERLPVFIGESQTQGNRIFLYLINVEMPVETEN